MFLKYVRFGLGSVIARAIELWVQLFGNNMSKDFASWLAGPIGGKKIGADMYEEYARQTNSTVELDPIHAGLLPTFAKLKGPTFNAAEVDPAVQAFYEHTADYILDSWSKWSG